MPQKPLILVDGSSYLFRAYHALPPLTNSKGQATGAIYGVVNMLRRLIKDYQPEQLAVVFDPPGKTFRHQLYPDYKANRSKMPEELAEQIKPLFELITAMGLTLIVVEGVEADDVIGTLAKRATAHQQSVVISTGDKDMAQLVNESVTLINTMNNTPLDIAGVQKKFGVLPQQIIDYLSLIGDSSDNVPGVDKVGPKTAVKWLASYHSLDNIIAHAEEIKGKVGENLRHFIAQAPLVKELITIRCNVELPPQAADLSLAAPQHQKLVQQFSLLEFKSWLKEQLTILEQCNAHSAGMQNASLSTASMILTQTDFNAYVKKLSQADLFSFDSETTSLDYMSAEIVGLSFAIQSDQGVYIPLAHDYLGVPTQLDRLQVLATLKPILEDDKIKKVGQNLKYDQSVLENYDIQLKGVAFDTMLESYVYNSTASRHDMDSLALQYLGYRCISYHEVCGKGRDQINFSAVTLEKATPYAVEDAEVTLKLHHYFWQRLQTEPMLKKILLDIEMPMIAVLVTMERCGVLIDSDYLQQQSVDLAERLAEIENSAYQQVGHPFNLNSPKQLQEILFEKMQLPVLRKTPKGLPSTAEDVLQDLAMDFPLPKLVLEYRSLSKLKSTYTDRLPQQINPKTGRVHTSYHQAVASTGRLSSSHPNLQNIPTKSKEGRKIRQAFVAAKGYQLIAADYSQVELRIMAHLSDDVSLKEAFADHQDIHAATAAQVFAIALDQVNAEQRRKAKAINFGLIYGMSAFGLAKQIGVDRAVAQHYIDTYFERYQGVKQYMDDVRKLAHQQGFVETLFGRRLYLSEINSNSKMRQLAAERLAINAPMQGTASDIIKLAMINIHHYLCQHSLDARMIMQVHDELVFEVAEADVATVQQAVKQFMEQAVSLSVPLVVDIGVGHNWDQAH